MYLSIIGTRPQFVKCSQIDKYSDEGEHSILDTCQHYDNNLSQNFLKEFDFKTRYISLNKDYFDFGECYKETGEKVDELKPKGILVYGDTYSTLIGALVALHRGLPIFHIEAGLRSNSLQMEEHNRVMVDAISSVLLAPTKNAVKNLENENIKGQILFSGDLSLDIFKDNYVPKSEDGRVLLTFHRAENTDNHEKLKNISYFIKDLSKKFKVIFPIHPRTKKELTKNNLLDCYNNVEVIEPVGYREILRHVAKSVFIITDSGGLQKECFFAKKNVLNLRDVTEWVETRSNNFLCDALRLDSIQEAYSKCLSVEFDSSGIEDFGDGYAAKKIIKSIKSFNT